MLMRIRPRAVALLAVAATLQAAHLTVRVTGGDGRPLWSRVEVRGPGGRMFQPSGAIRDHITKARGGEPWYLGSFVTQGEAQLEVPAGRYTIVAEHGLEYERGERTADIEEAATVQMQLRPWVRMNRLGWYSGDVHIHRPPEEAPALAWAEDLNVSVLTPRGAVDWGPLEAQPVRQADAGHVVSLMNYEDERRGGSWILDGLRAPLALGRLGAWYPPGIALVRQARARRAPGALLPWFDIDMPIWWEVPVMMALAAPDSLDILHNQFMQYGIDTGEYWGRPYDHQRYAGGQGFVDYSLGLYYRYLNLGMHVAATAGTGSGVMPSPPGYNRVYARTHGPLTLEAWYAAIREGRSFVTNGPMLFFEVRTAAGRLRGTVEARAREPIGRVEIVANGVVLKRYEPREGSRRWRARFDLEAGSHSWVLARCFLKPGATVRLAQSAPVWLAGQWDGREDARYFREWMDDLIAHAEADSRRFASAAQREEVLGLYRKAREFYDARCQ